MAIQWCMGFDENPDSASKMRYTEWDDVDWIGTNSITNGGSSGPGWKSFGASFLPASNVVVTKYVTDNSKITIGMAILAATPNFAGSHTWLSLFGSGSFVRILLGWRSTGNQGQVNLMIQNGIAGALTYGTKNYADTNWHNLDVCFDRANNLISVFADQSSTADLTIATPAGWTFENIQSQFALVSGTSTPVPVDDMVCYDTVSVSQGPTKVYTYLPQASDVSTFNSGDGSSSDPLSVTTEYADQYRASNTSGNEDRFTFSALPDGVAFTSIKAVVNSQVVSSGNYNAVSSLKSRLTVGGTAYDTNIGASVLPFYPRRVSTIYANNPATATAWTLSDVRAIKAGYAY